MNKKTIYIIVAVLVIVIVAAAAGILLMNNNNPAPTPTPTPTTGNGIADATTLTYSANVTNQGATTEYKWSGKNIHSTNITLRVDFANYAYIIDASQNKSWISTDSGATWAASTFTGATGDWASWEPQWTANVDNLTQWSGTGNAEYTDATGSAVVMFNIVVNPTIPDSTFTATT